MQVTYGGEHSLLIGDFVNDKYDRSGFIHTWEDLHLIPTTSPVILPPPLKTNTVDIPGANGSVDMTEILLGRPLYENRTGSIDFYIDNSSDEYNSDGGYRWDYAYDKILNSIHGFKKKVILTDSMSYFYEGRVSVNSYKSDKLTGTISLDYDLEPFKASVCSTSDQWLWDPFDFMKGVIVDRSWFVRTLQGSSSGPDYSPIFEFGNEIAGVSPQIPTITVQLPVPRSTIDWDKSKWGSYGIPVFGIQPEGDTTRLWCCVNESDIINDASELITIFKIKAPTTTNGTVITIGNPRSNYKFNYQYDNTFKDSDDNPITATYIFDFRPRRL